MADPTESTIVNGLLCSIMGARSRNASKWELANVIDRTTPEADINVAWAMLLTLYKEAEDKNQKKKIIDI